MNARRPALTLRDVICAFLLGLAALALYVATLQPDFGGPEDTPKFQFVGYVLGTAHPPGYPLYSMLSHLFVQLPIRTIAYRANLFSAVMAALACALTYVIARQIGACRAAAFLAASGLATGASFWRSAVFAEVYSLAAVMAALTVTFLLAWGIRGRAGRLLAAVFSFGLGLGNHLTIVGLLPALSLYVWRHRRALTARVVMAGLLLMLIAVSQYAFIIVRTHQGAPYLESRASSLSELVAIVTAQRFAEQRFAFGPSALLTIQVPVIASLCRYELGIAGLVLLGAGLVAAIRQRNAEAGVVIGAAAGMLVMVMNLYGDFAGFLTPVMVFLWALVALGISAIAQALRLASLAQGRLLTVVALAAATAVPLGNLAANYRYADQSSQHATARFLRRVYADLPDQAGVVVEDYGNAMALQYFTLTRRRGKQIVRVENDAADVRRAVRDGRRVFAFANAATVLGAEGLLFERVDVTGTPLDDWLRELPRGTVVVGATAHAAAPFDPAALGHSTARQPGRARSFEAFVLIAQEPSSSWSADDRPISLTVESGGDSFPLPAFDGPLILSGDSNGARIDLSGRTIARVDTGLVLGVFSRGGRLLRTLELPAGEAPQVPFLEALYELRGETPCANLTTESWTEVGNVLSSGSWLASLSDIGSVVIESVFPQSAGMKAWSGSLVGDGESRTVEGVTDGHAVFLTEMTRSGENRPVFRMALDRAPAIARARVKPGGIRSFAIVCQHRAVRPLFPEGGNVAVLSPAFESEAYFGVGWGGAERTGTGPVRRAEDTSTLLLPLENSFSYRIVFDVVAGNARLGISVNGAGAGTCDLGTKMPCEVTLESGVVRQGVNAITLVVRRQDASAHPQEHLTLRGARIVREVRGG